MEIRIARQEDLLFINEIYNQAVRQRFCTAHLSEVLAGEREQWFKVHTPARYPVYVAVDEQHVIAWISLGPYRKGRQALAHVAEVSYFVEAGQQGKGVGSSLMQHAINLAPSFGFSVLVAILLNENRNSIGLLEKFGFSEWGRMPEIARIDNQLADHLYYGLKL